MKKVVLKNFENGGYRCYFTGKDFAATNGTVFFYDDKYPVSPEYAMQNGFDIDPKFNLPSEINSRVKLGEFITGTLKVHRGQNFAAYSKLYQELGAGLPMGENTYQKSEHS